MTSPIRLFVGRWRSLGVALAVRPGGHRGRARGGAAPVTAPDAVQTSPGNLAASGRCATTSDPEGDKLRDLRARPGAVRRHPPQRLRRPAGLLRHTSAGPRSRASTRSPTTPATAHRRHPARSPSRWRSGRGSRSTRWPADPGRLRVTNGASFRIRFLYGDYTKDDAEGDLEIPKKSRGRLHSLHPDRLVRVRPDAGGQHRRGGPRPRAGDRSACASPVTEPLLTRRVPRMSPRRALGTLLVLAVSRPRPRRLARRRARRPCGDRLPAGDHARRGTVFQGGFASCSRSTTTTTPTTTSSRSAGSAPSTTRGCSVRFVGNDWAIFAKPAAKPAPTRSPTTPATSATSPPGPSRSPSRAPEDHGQEDRRPARTACGSPTRRTSRSGSSTGSFKEDQPDGSVLIARKDSSVVITVHRTRIDWIATDRKSELFFVSGHVDRHRAGAPRGPARGRVRPLATAAGAWRAA